MIFADTHTHLYLSDFDKDRSEVMRLCCKNGVKYLFFPNIDLESVDPMINVCNEFSNCHPMMGLHPSEVKGNYKLVLNKIIQTLDNGKFCGVGEIGMDLYWDKTYIEEQKKAVSEQLEYAIDKSLPAIIHCRKAFAEMWDVLKQFKGEFTGIFHCFAGDLAQAKKVIDKGFMIGVGGTLTYKNSKIQEVVKSIDLKHIVLETDSPFLAPVPYRGKRNNSSYIPLIAQKLSELKNTTIEKVAETTTENALQVFKLK